MAIKGTIAKENVNKILQKAFGDDYIGEKDKKIYVWAKDEVGKVQIAISMTCPKNEISVIDTNNLNFDGNGIDFENSDKKIVSMETAELTEEEEKNIADLMKVLGL